MKDDEAGASLVATLLKMGKANVNKRAQEKHHYRSSRLTESSFSFKGEYTMSESHRASIVSGARHFRDDGAGAGAGAGPGALAGGNKRARVELISSGTDEEDGLLGSSEDSSDGGRDEDQAEMSEEKQRLEKMSTDFFVVSTNVAQFESIRSLVKKYFGVTMKRKNVSNDRIYFNILYIV